MQKNSLSNSVGIFITFDVACVQTLHSPNLLDQGYDIVGIASIRIDADHELFICCLYRNQSG